MKRDIGSLLVGCVLVLMGIVAGWSAARQGRRGGGIEAAEAHAAHAAFSSQALRNLGVALGEVEVSDYVRSARVQATVIDAPLNEHPVAAPIGGIVSKLHVKPGDVVEAGQAVVTIVREAIRRPELALTADILTPVSENLHESVSSLRTAVSQLGIVSAELERVRPFVEDGTLPRKTLIDLQYDHRRAERDVTNARRELEWHGLSAGEIDAVAEGKPPPGNQRLWRRALEKNGLWGKNEGAIFELLPARDQELPWSVAAIGELSAAGLATDELVTALREVRHLSKHFVETASMLLEGNSVAKVRLLCQVSAFEPLMVLKAPASDVADWDVEQVLVRPGQRVAAGEAVAMLHNPREMWLQMEPLGDEIAAVARALEAGTPMRADALLSGTAPPLEGLTVARLDTRGAQEGRGARAYAVCANAPVASAGDSRSWRLRVGLRYLVHVPVETLKQCIVLPAGAVTSRGPDRIVFVQDGDSFRAEPVFVRYEDDEIAVLEYDGAIAPGDPIVETGAFALGLAMQMGVNAPDAHAGHSHG